MSHIDQDVLALMALGELSADAAESEHLVVCVVCADELAELRRVVSLARPGVDEPLVEPPPAVWAGIAAELGFDRPDVDADAAVAGRGVADRSGASSASGPSAASATGAHTASDERRPQPSRSPQRAGRPRRRLVGALVAAAAVAGIVVGLGVSRAIPSPPTQTPSTRAAVVSSATLDPLPGWTGSAGSAELERDGDGRLTLVVRVGDDRPAAGSGAPLREVWMMRADHRGLVSMGYLEDGRGRFTVPNGVDSSEYPLVDVSAEADDGDPAHSGNSVVRGRLTAGT